jgi:hypothetical protein
LEKAKQANESRTKIVQAAEEVDKKYRYREKTLEYCRIMKGLYESEFPRAIEILTGNGENKFATASGILKSKLEEMKASGLEMEAAREQFCKKYDINPDDIKISTGN